MKTRARALHAARALSGKGQSLSDSSKYAVLGNTAGVALIDGRPKRVALSIVPLVVTPKQLPRFIQSFHQIHCTAGRN